MTFSLWLPREWLLRCKRTRCWVGRGLCPTKPGTLHISQKAAVDESEGVKAVGDEGEDVDVDEDEDEDEDEDADEDEAEDEDKDKDKDGYKELQTTQPN